MEPQKHWTFHLEFLMLVISIIGGFYLLDTKIERQSVRTDRLYQMIMGLTKENS